MRLKHIRTQFTFYYLLLICLSVLLFEALIIGYSGFFFYGQLETQLRAELQPLVQTLQKAMTDQPLTTALGSQADLFSKTTAYEVQVYDPTGARLIYTYGEWAQEEALPADVSQALNGQDANWRGKLTDGRKVMTFSRPLLVGGEVAGVVRLMAPLEAVDAQVKRMATFFLGIGLVVIVVTSVGAYVLADTVTTPILKLIGVTRRMSSGDFSVSAVPAYADEIGELAEGINHLASEIRKRDYLKNKMFSSVSHELRTPLTAIRGWAETLNDPLYTRGSEELEDGLGVIVSESDRLQQMVEELLDFSRMMSIEMSYQFVPTDWVDVIEQVVQTLKPKAADKQVSLTITEAPETLVAALDSRRIQQLLINLTDNALKFTTAGGSVAIGLRADAVTIYVTVEDTGCGISPEELPFVKERFYKGSHAGSHLGIGLALCDEIIKAHQGTWSIKSALGQGTIVEMCFPRA